MDLNEKDYVVIVQCQIAMDRCSGFLCEKAFSGRAAGFADYPADKTYRTLYLTCGGCCGKRIGRKLTNLIRMAGKADIPKDRIVVQLSSCMTTDNFHYPPCPNLEYIRKIIDRLGLDCRQTTVISKMCDKRRADGVYDPLPDNG